MPDLPGKSNQIIFVCRKTGQQGTKCTESCPTNKQNIRDLQNQSNSEIHPCRAHFA